MDNDTNAVSGGEKNTINYLETASTVCNKVDTTFGAQTQLMEMNKINCVIFKCFFLSINSN